MADQKIQWHPGFCAGIELELNRIDDAFRAAEDPAFREAMYRELQIA